MTPNTPQDVAPYPNEAAVRRRNVITGLGVLAVVLGMMAISVIGRLLMVPVLFKT